MKKSKTFDDKNIKIAQKTTEIELQNLLLLNNQWQDKVFCHNFLQLLQIIKKCNGRVLVSGVGKSGIIGKKISTIFSSIGIASFFIHPVEAVHGDLGCICKNDILIAISCSGNTQELQSVVNYCNHQKTTTVFICCNTGSWLEKNCQYGLVLNMKNEAIDGFPIPTTSSVLTLAVCDALTACLVKETKLTRKKYGNIHCGGVIGKTLNNRLKK